MNYKTIKDMVDSPGLRDRLIGVAAMEGRADAPMWVEQNIYRLVGTTELVDVWEYAEANKTINVNQDTGARTDTIIETMLLARTQAVIAEDNAAAKSTDPDGAS